jgi:hypothetical protein
MTIVDERSEQPHRIDASGFPADKCFIGTFGVQAMRKSQVATDSSPRSPAFAKGPCSTSTYREREQHRPRRQR